MGCAIAGKLRVYLSLCFCDGESLGYYSTSIARFPPMARATTSNPRSPAGFAQAFFRVSFPAGGRREE